MRVAVVIHPFGVYAAGDRIIDKSQIDRLAAGAHAHHVVVTDHDISPQDLEAMRRRDAALAAAAEVQAAAEAQASAEVQAAAAKSK